MLIAISMDFGKRSYNKVLDVLIFEAAVLNMAVF